MTQDKNTPNPIDTILAALALIPEGWAVRRERAGDDAPDTLWIWRYAGEYPAIQVHVWDDAPPQIIAYPAADCEFWCGTLEAAIARCDEFAV